jgi:chemotaxis protein methyltransferase CheR
MTASISADPRASSLEDIEVRLLLEGVRRHFGLDFGRYASPSLRRRLRLCMEMEGVHTISALQDRVLHDSDSLRRFVRTVSIQVTAMFRDPRLIGAVRRHVVPWLRSHPSIRIWHAGCSTGEEVLSMAVLLDEEGLLERSRLYGTDVDPALLEQAAEGSIPLPRLAGYVAAHRRAGGTGSLCDHLRIEGDRAVFDPCLRSRITWAQHNLATDGSFNDFHLLLCSNVLIYLDREPQRHALDVLAGSVVPFGFLGLGAREMLGPGGVEDLGFRRLDADANLYKRTR